MLSGVRADLQASGAPGQGEWPMASGSHFLPERASCGTKTGICPQWCGAGVGGRLQLGASFRLTTLELRDPH